MNEREFSIIVKETKAVVLSAIEKHLAERFYHAIDDVAQETYLRAYRGLSKGSFRAGSSISTWLYSIARNESLRMNSRLMREEEKARRKASHEESSGTAEEPDTSVLRESIASLPAAYRSVLELLAEGMKIKDIAGRLGIKPGTVKSRASRGKQMIQEGKDNNDERD